MSCYDMENVAFKGRRTQHLALEVPGLAERRPSLVHGDSIFAKLASECGNETSPPYQVRIKNIVIFAFLTSIFNYFVFLKKI